MSLWDIPESRVLECSWIVCAQAEMRGGNGSMRPLRSPAWVDGCGGAACGTGFHLAAPSAPAWADIACLLTGFWLDPVLSVLCDYWCVPHAATASLLECGLGGKRSCLFSCVRDGKWRADTAPCHIQFLFSLSHFLQNTNLTFFSDITGFTYCLRTATFPQPAIKCRLQEDRDFALCLRVYVLNAEDFI